MPTPENCLRHFLRRRGFAPIFAFCLGSALTGRAQITAIATFNATDGSYPHAELTLSSDGQTFYGTTENGGAEDVGTVFSVPVAGGTPTTLFSFNGTDGSTPFGGLTLIGGMLFGTASGGINGYGEVFSLPVAGASLTAVSSFPSNGPITPEGGLTLSADGKSFYGTTQGGGANSYGAVFSVPVLGGATTTLASFNYTDGMQPTGNLTLAGNTLYGTTSAGGASNHSTIFSVPTGGGTPTTLYSFDGTTAGEPFGSLTLIGTTLYGTTYLGGANRDGTVFSLPLTGGTPTILATFNGADGADGADGASPAGSLTLSADGTTFYGTTRYGGANNDGTVFSLPVTGGTPITLGSFDGTNGLNPDGTLTLIGSTLYGTTAGSGNNNGTVFSLQLVPELDNAHLLWVGLLGVAFGRRRNGRRHAL